MTEEERLKELEKYMAPGHKQYKDVYHSSFGLQPSFKIVWGHSENADGGNWTPVKNIVFEGYKEVPYTTEEKRINERAKRMKAK